MHRTALRLAEDDRRLTDREWRKVAERYVKEMGFENCPWTAMRHGEEHIHITVSRVQWDGRLASDAHDFRRSHQAARSIERAHGLVDASERSNPGRPQVQSGERARAERTGQPAPRDTLRERLDLTGTKKGCDHGQCGACTVHVNGQRTLSCLMLAVMQQGKEITTIEGLAKGEELHPMQAAFLKHDGLQCGYCTPGQIMAATALLQHQPPGSAAEIREAMSGNLCRCAAYPNILAAIQAVQRA